MADPTNVPFELRTQIAATLRGLGDSVIGQVVERQVFSKNWDEFARDFTWTAPDGKKWVRGWMVLPNSPQAQVVSRTFGAQDVEMRITHRVLVRGVQSMTESSSTQYEPFNDVAWKAFLALSARRRYTLAEGRAILTPDVSWESYQNRRIAGAACHTAEIVMSFAIDVTVDLT